MSSKTGGCLCGKIRYSSSGEPEHQLVCHCRMCQRASGSACMGLIFVASSDMEITQGEPRSYQSSPTLIRHFCPDCGSPLFVERTSRGLYGILAGSLDDPSLFEPQMHICLSSSEGWLQLNDNLPRHQEKPKGMTPTLKDDSATGRVGDRR